MSSRKESDARTTPAGVRQRAIELARQKDRPIAEVAKGLGISESCLRNWLRQADADEGPAAR